MQDRCLLHQICIRVSTARWFPTMPKQDEQTNSLQSSTAKQGGCELALRVPGGFCCERQTSCCWDRWGEGGWRTPYKARAFEWKLPEPLTWGTAGHLTLSSAKPHSISYSAPSLPRPAPSLPFHHGSLEGWSLLSSSFGCSFSDLCFTTSLICPPLLSLSLSLPLCLSSQLPFQTPLARGVEPLRRGTGYRLNWVSYVHFNSLNPCCQCPLGNSDNVKARAGAGASGLCIVATHASENTWRS